jgi:hypothetical protein
MLSNVCREFQVSEYVTYCTLFYMIWAELYELHFFRHYLKFYAVV